MLRPVGAFIIVITIVIVPCFLGVHASDSASTTPRTTSEENLTRTTLGKYLEEDPELELVGADASACTRTMWEENLTRATLEKFFQEDPEIKLVGEDTGASTTTRTTLEKTLREDTEIKLAGLDASDSASTTPGSTWEKNLIEDIDVKIAAVDASMSSTPRNTSNPNLLDDPEIKIFGADDRTSTSTTTRTTSKRRLREVDPDYKLVGVVLMIRDVVRSAQMLAKMTQSQTGLKILPPESEPTIEKRKPKGPKIWRSRGDDQTMERFGKQVALAYCSLFNRRTNLQQVSVTHSNRWNTAVSAAIFDSGLSSVIDPWSPLHEKCFSRIEELDEDKSQVIIYNEKICKRYFDELQDLKRTYTHSAIREMKNVIRKELERQQITHLPHNQDVMVVDDDLSMKMIVSTVEALYHHNPQLLPKWAAVKEEYFWNNLLIRYTHAVRLTNCQTIALMQALIGPIMRMTVKYVRQILDNAGFPVLYAHIGHDQDLFAMMFALNQMNTIRDRVDVGYGATLALEVLRHTSGQHFIRAFYTSNHEDFPLGGRVIKIDICGRCEYCPIQDFIRQVEKFIPKNYDQLCRSEPHTETTSVNDETLRDERIWIPRDPAHQFAGEHLWGSFEPEKREKPPKEEPPSTSRRRTAMEYLSGGIVRRLNSISPIKQRRSSV